LGFSIERIAKANQTRDIHFAPTRLLALENTIGGRVLPLAYQRQATEFAHAQGLRTHLDGARNLQRHRETSDRRASRRGGLRFGCRCASPRVWRARWVGVAGFPDLIAQARRWRKALGGGMRQAGRAGAAGLYALSIMCGCWRRITRMQAFSRDGLRALGLHVEPPQTNILYVRIPDKNVEGSQEPSRRARHPRGPSGLARVWSRIWMYRF